MENPADKSRYENKKHRTILLVEDDEVDIMTIKRAAKKLDLPNPMEIVFNGEEALQYLEDSYPELPGIIVLDINMPRMNGIELLGILKKDERFLRIPVVVLTTSKEHRDRYESFNLNVAGYMVKPVVFNEFVRVVDIIHRYWETSEHPD